jgi:hypothetical protein
MKSTDGISALAIARRGLAAIAVVAVTVFGAYHTPAAAQTHFVCTPDAIKAKKEFVVARFSDYLAGKYAKTSAFRGVMSKIWDGQGDCDTAGDIDGIVEKVPRVALLDFVTARYYADIMSASADIAAKKFADARPFIDDYKAIHGLITGGVRQAFNPDFFSQDRMLASAMRTYDVQVANNGIHSVVAGR